ncbi:Phospholipase C [Pseudogymnoascus destructans]|uniref:Phospholipase C n=1 Tax=Pseudogymnoascus destructans TaxID=655981 RepID=A0A177AG19_9PEZI|nr:Phospholipase C [Pseudogymnoascus destructans]OAF60123.1 Phospholipase C [Pseudogymnoascus destructans]
MVELLVQNDQHCYNSQNACQSLLSSIENDRDLLSEQDWIELQKLQDFLLTFHHATLSTEACGDTIDKVLLSMDFLLEQFEDAKRVYAEDSFMSPCCNSGWAKLDKYYTLTDRSPVYIADLVLCPQWKWDYIESSWLKEWHADCKAKMQEFWESDYKLTAVSVPTQASQATESANSGVSNAFT